MTERQRATRTANAARLAVAAAIVAGGALAMAGQAAADPEVPYPTPVPAGPEASQPVGLTRIDHLTHNVKRGNMNLWAGFYEKLFNFKEIRYFSIEGKETGLFSRALTSPCGKIRIPINESQDDKSQIEEYLNEYKGEGIQHIALGTDDIYRTVDALRNRGVEFQDTPATYYEGIDKRVEGPHHIVELKLAGTNQRAEVTAPGTAIVILPTRASGTIVLPVPPADASQRGAEMMLPAARPSSD